MRQPFSLKIGHWGIRGVVGESLRPKLVTSFAAAFGTYCGAGPIAVGTDRRPSGEMLKQAVFAGLQSVGSTPVDLGIVPAPALQRYVLETGAFGGVCISASHRPVEWNALRFCGPGGMVLRANQAAELADLWHQARFPRADAESIPLVRGDDTAVDRHIAAVLALVDVEAIRARGFTIAIDTMQGAAAKATPRFLAALGCQVLSLNGDAAEPTAESLAALGELVRAHQADLGFAQDADGDRLALVDEHGHAVADDAVVALAARHVLRRRPGTVVVSSSTSRLIDDVAAACDSSVVRTRVGEVNVVEAMLEVGAEIGGEGNGGVILPAINPCRDSFIAMALLLDSLAADGTTVSELRATLPSYAMVRRQLDCPLREMAPALRRLRRRHQGEQISLIDGVTVQWPDRWVQARPSNTEPVLRVAAEAATQAEAESLVRDAADCLRPAR
jgi:phosphomannomutase